MKGFEFLNDIIYVYGAESNDYNKYKFICNYNNNVFFDVIFSRSVFDDNYNNKEFIVETLLIYLNLKIEHLQDNVINYSSVHLLKRDCDELIELANLKNILNIIKKSLTN